MTIKSVQLALAVVPLVLAPLAQAGLVTAWNQVADGTFNGDTTSDAPEWSGANVAKQSFAIAGDGSGGSTVLVGYLYQLFRRNSTTTRGGRSSHQLCYFHS